MSEKNKVRKGVALGVFLLLCLGSLPVIGSTIPNENTSSYYNVHMLDDTTMEISITTPPYSFGMIQTTSGDFTTITVSDEGFTTVVGEAKLPVLNLIVEIPCGAIPQLSVDSISYSVVSLKEQNLPSQIVPVQPSVSKTQPRDTIQPFAYNEYYYTQDNYVPYETGQVSIIGEIRGRTVAQVQIYPVQYNPFAGELKLLNTCIVRVDLSGGDLALTSENIERYSSTSFEQLYASFFENYGYYASQTTQPLDPEGYLIIVADSYNTQILPFATWKEGLGFDVTVTKTSEIPGGVTTTSIKNYITTAYNTWPIPPTYVLLVGDVAQIPTYTGSQTSSATDLYYVTITGGDYFPEMLIGRFPAASSSQVTAMVDKTIYYEQGAFPSTDWIKKAAFMASQDNYGVSEGTHNYVINTYLNPHGYTCDKLYCHTYSATTQQVRNALNNGRSLAIYSGHGSETSWADGPYFTQSDINGLTNTGMYPFVCSHACLTGDFETSECFGETWLRAANKGGVAFWGASTYSYWGEDDILEKKMFYAWWVDNLETIGGMTSRGLYYLYQYYSGGGLTRYYFEEYNVLGDPSVKIWSDNPARGEISVAPASFDLTVPTGETINDILTISNDPTALGPLVFTTSIPIDIIHGVWLTVSPTSGSIPIGSSLDLTVTVNAANLPPGTYGSQIKITSNDLDEHLVVIPVTVLVTGGGTPDVTVDISSAMTQVPRNSNFVFTVSITNNEPTTQTLKVWTAAQKLPSGSMIEPIKGPMTITVNAGQTRIFSNIPQYVGGVPLGTYRYYARIGENCPTPLWDEDYWDFEVIP